MAFGFLMGCGGATGEASSATVPHGEATTGGDEHSAPPSGGSGGHRSARAILGIAGPQVAWSEMSHEDKEMDMIGRFLPIMQEFFLEHDAVEYANFSCDSCHGAAMRERNFAMPAPELPAVPAANTPAYEAMRQEHEETTRFMEEVVTPTMGTLLGWGEAFNCWGCHTTPPRS